MASKNNFEKILEDIRKSRGEISESNYTDVDALIFAELAGIDIKELPIPNAYSYNVDTQSADYTNMHRDYTPEELVRAYEAAYTEEELANHDKYQLLKALAESERYKNIKLSNFANCPDDVYVDEFGNEYAANFKAVTVDLGNTKVIAYAGTGASIYSWLEDGRMASAEDGIGAQVWGKEYAEFVMNLDSDKIMFAGYSKGGNQAIYSAVLLWPEYADRICKVINVDGPGFNDEALQEYIDNRTFYDIWEELCDKGILDSTTTPYESFVGHLMENHENYKYIQADNWLFFVNHDYMNWNITLDENGNPTFTKADSQQMAEVGEKLDQLVNTLLDHMSSEELTAFINILDKYCHYVGVDTVNEMAAYFSENGIESLGTALIEFYNTEMTDAEKEAFNKAVNALLINDHLEEFLIAWRKQLESTGNAEAENLAATLEKMECLYPAFTGALDSLELDEIMSALGIVNGYLKSVGGTEGFQKMSNTEITLSAVAYFYTLPAKEREQVVNCITEALASGVVHLAKENSLIFAIGLWVAESLLGCDLTQTIAEIAEKLMAVLVGLAVIVSLWIEFQEALYEAYEFVREVVLDFMEKLVSIIESAIDKLKSVIKSIIDYIAEEVTKTKEAGKYIVKEQVTEFAAVWSVTTPNPSLRLTAIVTYALKNAYESAHIHVEFDLTRLGNLVSRLKSVASKASSLEGELDSFYWYLKNTKVKISEKKTITLAKKYGISRYDLDPNRAGKLRAGSSRLDSAYCKLRALDGTLLS